MDADVNLGTDQVAEIAAALGATIPATPASNPPPSIGHIVHLATPFGPAAAIVTKVWSPDCVNLSVFHDAHAHVQPLTSVMYDPDGEVGTWSWPPRI